MHLLRTKMRIGLLPSSEHWRGSHTDNNVFSEVLVVFPVPPINAKLLSPCNTSEPVLQHCKGRFSAPINILPKSELRCLCVVAMELYLYIADQLRTCGISAVMCTTLMLKNVLPSNIMQSCTKWRVLWYSKPRLIRIRFDQQFYPV